MAVQRELQFFIRAPDGFSRDTITAIELDGGASVRDLYRSVSSQLNGRNFELIFQGQPVRNDDDQTLADTGLGTEATIYVSRMAQWECRRKTFGNILTDKEAKWWIAANVRM